MSRYSVSPLKATTRQNDPRDNIIKKLKEDLIVARGRQKQLNLLQNYLIQLIQKTKLLTAQTVRCDEEGKLKLQMTNKSLNQLKKQLQAMKNDLRAISNQLEQIESEELQYKKILNNRMLEIQRHKKQGNSIHDDNDKLIQEQNRLRNQFDQMNGQLKKGLNHLKQYQAKLSEISKKIIEVKGYINEINEQNMILRQNLKKFQIQNTEIGNDLQIKQSNIDFLQKSFAEKHQVIKSSVEAYIQLQNHNEKIVKQTRQKSNLIKIQNEKSNELSNVIKKIDRDIHDKSRALQDTLLSSEQLRRVNQDFFNENNKLKEQLRNCQQHLQKLMKNNVLMNEQMEKYVKEDEKIINLLRLKRLIGIQNMKVGRQSIRASPLKLGAKNQRIYQ